MKMSMISCVLLICVSALFISCGSSKNNNKEGMMTGNDKDEHGCIASAGYTWSEVQKDCIRLWEKGVRMESIADTTKTAYLIFSPDSAQIELFFSGDQPNEILDRRSLPSGGYAWNVEDDDTKNVRIEAGRWTISQRGNLIYRQSK